MAERKLATIRVISDLRPIEGADKIETASVDGWNVVVEKGKYSVGEKVVFLEVDSFVPHEMAPFLSKGKEPSEFEGVKGERLRSMKLRGQLSQGLILPTSIRGKDGLVVGALFDVGADVTDFLNIKKWERPIPTQLQGQVKGSFPSFIPKTDQERVQNLTKGIEEHAELGTRFEVTEKLDGSSMTVFLCEGEFGVCSRNLQLKIEGNENNAFVKTAIALGLEEKLKEIDCGNLALQGELVGEGIQGNPYGLKGLHYFVYNVYAIDDQDYFPPTLARYVCEDAGISYVPVINERATITTDVEELLSMADGNSNLNPKARREGLVFKSIYGDFSFKAISNRWLLSGGE